MWLSRTTRTRDPLAAQNRGSRWASEGGRTRDKIRVVRSFGSVRDALQTDHPLSTHQVKELRAEMRRRGAAIVEKSQLVDAPDENYRYDNFRYRVTSKPADERLASPAAPGNRRLSEKTLKTHGAQDYAVHDRYANTGRDKSPERQAERQAYLLNVRKMHMQDDGAATREKLQDDGLLSPARRREVLEELHGRRGARF